MARLFVIYDTNVYRGFSRPDFDIRLQRERERSIVGFASFWVAKELLAHLASQADPSFKPARASIYRLNRHCAEYDGSRSLIRFVADSERHACVTLFGRDIPGRVMEARLHGEIIGTVANFSDSKNWSSYQANLEEIAQHNSDAEKQFASDVWDTVVRPVAPGASSWKELPNDKQLQATVSKYLDADANMTRAANSIVVKAARDCNVQLTQELIAEKSQYVRELFPTSLRLFHNILLRVFKTGYDLSNPANSNSLWDFQISMQTSQRATLSGSPLWLIADDKLVTDSARDVGSDSIILTSAAYEEILKMPIDDFADLVRQ